MEILDICDEKGLPTGRTIDRNIAHRDGILHRTAHVWVVRESGAGYDVLLQKRSMQKDSFPGLYDTSSAGHIPAGEEPVPSAIRELREELGITALPSELDFAGTFRIHYEPVDIRTLHLQESEVDEVRWFDIDEVWKEIQNNRERFCVPTEGLNVLRRYLKLS